MPSAKINCLVGANGMGKTNLLDAVYYLSFCKSSISSTDASVILHGADSLQIQGTYTRLSTGNSTQISCCSKAKGKKQFKRDRKEYQRLSDHIGCIPLVMVSPFDTDLIEGGGDTRRRFMDMVISQYDKEYLSNLISYTKALAQRNSLLKSERPADPELYLMWEHTMAVSAQLIYGKRASFVESVIPHFQSLYGRIGERSEEVWLSYTSHLERGDLEAQLLEARPVDMAVGYTRHGIHKDELSMTLCGYPIKREGSQGQNKSYLLALKLAQYMVLSEVCHGKRPLLLLDDIFDKLDSGRVERILKLVSGNDFGQIFLTDVNREHTLDMVTRLECDHKLFTVTNGTVL